MICLRCENLTKVFGKVVAINNISFDVCGEVIAIVGPNGSGKSTLLSIASGLRKPSKGRLFLNGFEPYKSREKVLSKISFSFEKPRFNISTRVKDVLDAAKDVCSNADILYSIAEKIGLTSLATRRLYEVSSGQAQLLSLIITLFCDTRSVAILDEPLAHLDVKHQGFFISSISSRRNVVFTTHVFEEAEAVADKIIVIDSGKVKWVGDTEKLYMSNMYEAIVIRKHMERFIDAVKNCGGCVVADFSTCVLIKNVSEDILTKLFREGVIVGYRRAGLRARIYG